MDPKEEKATIHCRECKVPTVLVEDRAAGDVICTECGLVLESRTVDESAEWRTFSNVQSITNHIRVGAPTNHLLKEGGLFTFISNKGARGEAATRSANLRENQAQTSAYDRNLITAFSDIETMADRLRLVTTIKDRANELYKKASDNVSFHGRKQEAILAACLYLACRQEGTPRSFKEIQTATSGMSVKEIGRATNIITKHLEEEGNMHMNMSPLHPRDYVKRFCSALHVSHNIVKAILMGVEQLKSLDIRYTPISIACGFIYMMTTVLGQPKTMREIAAISGTAESTIKNAYKSLFPHAAILIPKRFLQELNATLADLPAP